MGKQKFKQQIRNITKSYIGGRNSSFDFEYDFEYEEKIVKTKIKKQKLKEENKEEIQIINAR